MVASLAQAVGLDMRAWWQSTAEEYFSQVSKAQMMAAVPLEAMHKQRAAEAAARAVAGSGWLPEPLVLGAAVPAQ